MVKRIRTAKGWGGGQGGSGGRRISVREEAELRVRRRISVPSREARREDGSPRSLVVAGQLPW